LARFDRPADLAPRELVEELRSYIGFTDEDADRLREFLPHVLARRWEFSQRFYEFILRNANVRRIIEGNGHQIGSLQRTWEQWIEELFSGPYDEGYAASRLRIGAVHLHLGVEERLTVAAFNIVRQFLHDLVCEVLDHDVARCHGLLGAVNRVLDLDLSFICHAYDHALLSETVAEQSAERRGLEDLLGSLLATPSLLILSLDADGRIVHFHRGCELLLGIGEAEVLGRDYVEALVAPAGRESARADLERILHESRAHGGPIRSSPAHTLSVRGGGERLVTWYPTTVPTAIGGQAQCLWVGHDTTEERRLQEQIAHQEKMAAVGLLAAGVAHEIGNPLASISSVVQTVLRKSSDEYVRGKLDLVRTHIDRIATIVRRMVDFARPPRLEWRPCSVNELVRSAAHILSFDKRAKRVGIELDLDPALPTTLGMDDPLTQVFLNLLINSFDAVETNPPERPPSIRISTRLETRGGMPEIVFRCRDNGPGIEEPELRRIFEPFYTTKEVGRGTGLGLSVSFRIIEDHGGRIEVDSRPGEGACFAVRIPVRDIPPEEES